MSLHHSSKAFFFLFPPPSPSFQPFCFTGEGQQTVRAVGFPLFRSRSGCRRGKLLVEVVRCALLPSTQALIQQCAGLVCGVLLCCSVEYMYSSLFWSWKHSTELACLGDPSITVTVSDISLAMVRVGCWQKLSRACFSYLEFSLQDNDDLPGSGSLCLTVQLLFQFYWENLYWEVHKQCFITLVPIQCGRGYLWSLALLGLQDMWVTVVNWLLSFLFSSPWINGFSLNAACFFDLLPSQVGDQKFSDVFQCWKIKL